MSEEAPRREQGGWGGDSPRQGRLGDMVLKLHFKALELTLGEVGPAGAPPPHFCFTTVLGSMADPPGCGVLARGKVFPSFLTKSNVFWVGPHCQLPSLS